MASDDGDRIQEMISSLRGAGHRVTPQRAAVIQALVGTTAHPSVEQLHGAVVAAYPGLGLATVYNTLDLLLALGEIVALEFGEGRKRFEVRPRRPHAHLICTTCGRVEDVDGVEAMNWPVQEARRRGYQVWEQRFDLRGLCPDCQARPAGTQS